MQDEFNFDSASGSNGLETWRQQRQQQWMALAKVHGLPLQHLCRVELRGGVELEGLLGLAEDDLLLLPNLERDLELHLQIGRCIFTPREIVSVVRLD